MFKFTFYTFLILLGPMYSFAQQQPQSTPLKHAVEIHYNVGGLSPIPLPATIRKIHSYSPGFSPGLGYELQYKVASHWSLAAGVRLDVKAMRIKDSVQYFHTLIKVDSSEFEGNFSGTNFTDCRNVYLTLPITMIYHLGDNWRFKGGAYLSWLIHPYFQGDVSNGYIRKGNSLGEKVNIQSATFDFSTEQRTFDMGLQVGAQRQLGKYWFVKADLQWGLRRVFPSSFRGMDFAMYNVFGSVGAGIQL
ncbi:PorT family protein [Chitinophaga horti]|uniref:PorT family protein n=1 Tax=Chitinophaga horti TaxID=2920382 RepID=A0ABY6J7M5_9BACT|nr:PorT family protein [Chitinophaga horti]UYQ95688.1 PorT family protein [Chitinophaga horti]